MSYSIEKHYRVYDDSDGSYISVSPDADGLSLVEIRQVLPGGTILSRITMTREQADLLQVQLSSYLEDVHE